MLLLNPAYETDETAVVQEVVTPGSIAIDAGANFGWYTILLSRLVGHSGKVIAFEPVPESFAELLANMRLNSCENVSSYQCAVGDSSRLIPLYIPQLPMGAGAASQHLDAGKKITAQMVALDTFLIEGPVNRVDFIKADIEGGEFNLLRGAENLLRKDRPVVLLEIVDIHCRRFGHSPLDVVQYLESLGYRGKRVGPRGSLVPINPRWLTNGNYLFKHNTFWNDG